MSDEAPLRQRGATPLTDRVETLAPKLADMIRHLVFDDIWERPGLSPRDRSMITVAALTVLPRPDELAKHLARAKRNGVTREEMGEMMTHLAIYAGVPAALSASLLALDVYDGEASSS